MISSYVQEETKEASDKELERANEKMKDFATVS